MFKLTSSPHIHSGKRTARIMGWVLVALLPALGVQLYYFGFGVLFQILLALIFANILELLITKLRHKPTWFYVGDFSVSVTALMLAMAIPPYAPYWIILIGVFCAVILGKHVYGGLGQNIFNPAMVGYVILLISFPVQMTNWLVPMQVLDNPLNFSQAFELIFQGGISQENNTALLTVSQLNQSIDGITSATPLDGAKTILKNNPTQLWDAFFYQESIFDDTFAIGWTQLNFAFLMGGLLLIWKKIIHWQIPLAMLLSFVFLGFMHNLAHLDLEGVTKSIFVLDHLMFGAMMFGAFFIATDPVTAPVTTKGKWIFGTLVGSLLFLIRYFGSYPDGVAFSILLANICVPLIDQYSRPRVVGYSKK